MTQISQFWFELLRDTIPNHLITSNVAEMPASVQQYKAELQGRAMLVKKLKILPVEAIVRGYITGIQGLMILRSAGRGARYRTTSRGEILRRLVILIKVLLMNYHQFFVAIIGSGWNEYKKSGTVCDIKMPVGLKECEKLSEPLFSPSTKAELGQHGKFLCLSVSVMYLMYT